MWTSNEWSYSASWSFWNGETSLLERMAILMLWALMQKLPVAYWEQEENAEDEEGSSDLEKLLCTLR